MKEGNWVEAGEKWWSRKREGRPVCKTGKEKWGERHEECRTDRWDEVKEGKTNQEKRVRESRGAQRRIYFVHAKRGCCDDMTVIQTDTCSRDETRSKQA